MKKQAVLLSLFLIILFSMLACDVSGAVTPTPGVIASPEVATIATIAFNAPVPADTQSAPVATEGLTATVPPLAAGTSIAKTTPTKTGTPTPTATVVPNSRSNPIPAGSVFHLNDLQIVVSGITRPADDIVRNANALNFDNAAGAGKEYMFVDLSVTCNRPADQQCILSVYNFKVLGSEGVLINPVTTIAGVNGLLKDSPFFGGATETGNIPFIVTSGDANVLLVYQTVLGDAFYLALPAK
jgi:hypothetical protein